MLIHMIFILVTYVICTSSDNAGSAIFINKLRTKECWTEDEIIKLRARKLFEDLIPQKVEPNEIDTNYLNEQLQYFRKALNLVPKNANPHMRRLLREALSDTIGAHMRREILPAVRFAYYAGFVPFKKVNQMHKLFEEQKDFLNTQGNGWKKPDQIPKWSNLTVSKITVGTDTFFDPCAYLVLRRDANDCIHLPLPKLDDENEPTAIALPFKSGELTSLTSPNGNNILIKYYTTAAKCILSASPEKCRHTDFLYFNNEMWHWVKRHVAPHLVDEKLYTAFGGVLRIAAAVQNYGKGLTRRNLYDDNNEPKPPKWYTLNAKPQRCHCSDLTPLLYVALVIMTAIVICLMQMCYTFLCREEKCCTGGSCRKSCDAGYDRPRSSRQSEYIAETSNRQSRDYNDYRQTYNSSTKAKSMSLGSIRTQKVYDFHENTEKLMDIISDNEQVDAYSSSNESGQECDENDEHTGKNRSVSPPKIDTSISQIKLVKAHQGERSRMPMYSTSQLVKTDTGELRESDTLNAWSGSESSSTSTNSGSSSTSKSCKSKSSRDLAWARRVISKNSYRSLTRSSTKTELDMHSFTTPPSRRYHWYVCYS